MPELSVVIPCYDCGAHVARSVAALREHLETGGRSWEIVLVDDGSTDDTAAVLRSLADGVRVLARSFPRNRGKGGAVAEGMAMARGACRVFTDVDLPYRLDAIDRCADRVLLEGHPAVFGNRLLAESDASAQPLVRRVVGGAVRAAMGRLLGRADVDTQCGLKGFSGPLADALFPALRIDGFLFDAEATLLLTRAGVPISFVPVELRRSGASTIGFARTGLKTLREWWRLGRIRHDLPDLAGVGAAGALEATVHDSDQGKANT